MEHWFADRQLVKHPPVNTLLTEIVGGSSRVLITLLAADRTRSANNGSMRVCYEKFEVHVCAAHNRLLHVAS
jgi:hypothetical protein